MKMRAAKYILIFFSAIIGVIATLFLAMLVRINNLTKLTPEPVRSAAAQVLKAQFVSQFTGSYWEDEMLLQGKRLANAPLSQRLEFYKSILLNCDLDMSRGVLFVEMLGKDTQPLSDDLESQKDSAWFRNLSEKQRINFENWRLQLRPPRPIP